jgi:serine/threonine protein kinase
MASTIDAKYERIRTLGSGVQGTVWLGVQRDWYALSSKESITNTVKLVYKRNGDDNEDDDERNTVIVGRDYIVAVKEMEWSDDALAEAKVHMQMKHRGVAQIIEYVQCKQSNRIFLAMDFHPKTLLSVMLEKKQKTAEPFFSERMARHFFKQLLASVEYVHLKGFVHKDVKLESMFETRKTKKKKESV